MRRRRLRPIVALAALLPMPSHASSGFAPLPPPPPAPRQELVEERGGRRIADPYRPLEELDSPATRAWIAAEDARTRAVLDATSELARRRARLDELTRLATVSPPVAAEGWLFYLAVPAGASRASAWVVAASGGEPRRLVDGEALPAPLVLTGVVPSRDGRLLAYGVGSAASNWSTVRFLEVATARPLADELRGLHVTGGPVAWAPDGRSVVYGAFREPAPGEEQRAAATGERLLRHRLGAPLADDRLLFELPGEPTWSFSPRVSDDGELLVLTVARGAGVNLHTLVRPLADDSLPFVSLGETGSTTYLTSDSRRLVLRTTAGSPRGRIVAVDLERPAPSAWTTLLPERDSALYFANVVAGRLLVVSVRDARHVVEVFALDGAFEREVALPDLGTTFSGFVGRRDDRHAYFSFNSIAYPGGATVFRLDPASGETTPFARPPLPFDPADFVTEQVFFTSADGTRVPMFVAHRRDLPRDGRRPVLLYAYGAFGWAATPFYQPQVLAWLESGGVYAVANVRGGGEYGEAWHQAGVGPRKRNSLADYLAASEWLLASGWTAPGLLVAQGGSASGPLAALAIVDRPELYGAALVDIPLLDMVRFDRFTGGARWIPEFGSPDRPEELVALLELSPYHRLTPGRCLPPLLVTAGERDETAVPSHAYKFVARAQELAATAPQCASPTLLQVVWGGGHGYGTTREQRVETWARQLAFLDRVLRTGAAVEVDAEDVPVGGGEFARRGLAEATRSAQEDGPAAESDRYGGPWR